LHPVWQQRILKTLETIFPAVQFIVTTHSPTVISSAAGEQLLMLDGKQVSPYEYEVYGKDVNSVLSELMGTTARPAAVEKLFSRFNEALDCENIDEAKALLEQLRGLLGNHDNGVVSAAVALDFCQN
jgi:predicted ATP-binding protein involved in virulence